MATKRRFDEDCDDSSDDDEIDGEDSEVPDDLKDNSEDSSEDSEEVSTDEDDWQEETDISSVESESEDDSGEEPSRHRSKPNQQPAQDVFVSKSGRRWDKDQPPQRKIPQANILRQQDGIGRPAATIQAVKDAFQLLFTEEMVSIIVRETNRRAGAVTAAWAEQNPNKKWQWKDTNSEEIWAFIGLLILGGVQRSQNEHLDELWSTNNGRPIFRATLSKNRMSSLLRFCRFDDAATRDRRMEVDKLAPISEFWTLFLAQLQTCYVPGGAMTVDEQLMPTRGRCKFRQYMPNKPAKYGIKIFWCCDSKTAYPLKGEVYVGRQPGAATLANKNGIKDLVKRLVTPWINKGRSLTTDNYFTSVELAEDLLGVQTTLVGTIRKNKPDIPTELQPNRQRPENSSIFCFDRHLTLVSYVPKKSRAVILLSSMHHDMTVSEETHRKPEIILYYNETKGGVDHMDQMVQTYSCKRKINRWPMSFFFNMIDVAGIAAFIIWKTKNPQWNNNKLYRRRLFLQQLGRTLVDAHLNQRCQDPRAVQQGVRLAMQSLGLPMTRPTTAASKAGARRRCHLCPRSRDRKIATQCSICHFPCCSNHHKIICDLCLGSFNEEKKKKKK